MAGVPNVFGSATTSIPLSQLDANFNTTATLGNTAIGLGNVTTSVGNLTLTNVTIASGTTSVSGNSIVNGTSNVVVVSSGGNVTMATNGTQAMFVDTSQNVGIGTTSPTQKLVVSNSGAAGFEFNPTTGNFFTFNRSTVAYTDKVITTNNTIFQTGGGTERMRIDSSGNVGINIASPTTKLQVYTDGAPAASGNMTTGIAVASGPGSYAINIGAYSTGGYTWLNSAYINSSNTASPMVFMTGAAERMRIDSSGNLLVGGTTVRDQCKITVDTSLNGIQLYVIPNTNACDFAIFRANAGTLCGNISRVGTTAAVVYSATSDYRLKTVISPVINAGERIDALEPIEYDWNTGGHAKGFLAHKFAEVYPNSVSGEKDAVDAEGKPVYQSMQASTSEVMADLIAEIQSLRKRVAQLESK